MRWCAFSRCNVWLSWLRYASIYLQLQQCLPPITHAALSYDMIFCWGRVDVHCYMQTTLPSTTQNKRFLAILLGIKTMAAFVQAADNDARIFFKVKLIIFGIL